MTTYNIGLNATRTIAYVTVDPEPLPGAATIVLTDIEHDSASDQVHDYAGNHALAHHVRDLLYKRKAADGASGASYPDGMYDLSKVSITKYGQIWNAISLVVGAIPVLDASDVTTHTLVLSYHYHNTNPADAVATNSHFTFVSSDPNKATVSAAGLITAVAAGTTNITVTQANSGLSLVIPLTIVA